MKKWLVMLMMLLAMAGSAEARQVLPNISYDESSIHVMEDVEHNRIRFGLIENYKGQTYTVQFKWYASNYGNEVISYRYYKNGTWSGWQTRSLTSDSAQCLVFRDAWYYIKGYPFT